MRIRFVQGIASEHFAFRPKQEAEVEESLAEKWVASGIAAKVLPEIETATVSPPENAARRISRTR
jgi:hypothetical protein